MRASIFVIPVFGVQFLFLIYRPRHWVPYEIISALLTSLQVPPNWVLCCYSKLSNKHNSMIDLTLISLSGVRADPAHVLDITEIAGKNTFFR